REWDIALSCVPEMVADFRAAGLQSFHVNHAFAPRILDQLDPKSHPKIDFAFIGSVLKQNKFHVERERLLIQLVEHTNLQIFSDINFPSFRQRQKARIRRRLSDIFARAPERFLNKLSLPQKITGLKTPAIADQTIDKRIARRTHPPVFGLEMFQQIKDSCVVFNNHIDISPVSASNMRLFETTGAGACLITDWKENLPQLFEPDTEVLTYKSAAECVEKVRYILENEGERRKIAEAGQRRTLREHTFENRAARIDEIIRGAISASR
ncbi:MAG: CgeB family protein, partial [Pyrinomonadaceae bacterium]